MAWERSFEARVLKVRERELKYQKLNYIIEVLWNAIWFVNCLVFRLNVAHIELHRNGSPILVTLVSFWHFTVVRGQLLTPSVAFTSISGGYLVFSCCRLAHLTLFQCSTR